MDVVLLCPGQGAQAVGMGKSWRDASPTAAKTFARADEVLAGALPNGATLSQLCFEGPVDILNRTDVSQPALYACGVACFRALAERTSDLTIAAAAGLSLGEYTALHLAGGLSFDDGLRLVALRGKLMQQAAEASKGSMVALIGGDETQAQAVCDEAAQGEILVCANFNAPGQIVLSGHVAACQRALAVAQRHGLRATQLQVAGAFHSPLMAPAAAGLAKALESVEFLALKVDGNPVEVWSNVTAQPHGQIMAGCGNSSDSASIRKLLVDQLVSPVRWAQSCSNLLATTATTKPGCRFWEMAPGVVLKGLMRRIDRACEVITHDQST